MDLSGLPETAVDSEEDDDEEDIERASDPLMSRDIVRDCLEKDPMDRTDDDIGERPPAGLIYSDFHDYSYELMLQPRSSYFKYKLLILVHAGERHIWRCL